METPQQPPRVYEIRITSDAEESLKDAPAHIARRAKEKIQALARDPRPRGCLKLRGEDNLWRIRAGDWRVIYEIHDRILVVVVMDIDHRGDVYR